MSGEHRSEEKPSARDRSEGRRRSPSCRSRRTGTGGRAEEAEEVLSEPITYVAPVVKMDVPKVDNRMYRTQVKVRVKDRMAFLKGVKPETLLELLNEAAWSTIESGLSRKVKALGRAFSMPGCEVYEG
jgi:hypothetical protein